MREGWHGEDYLVLFDESELAATSERYEVLRLLPGFVVLQLIPVLKPKSQIAIDRHINFCYDTC